MVINDHRICTTSIIFKQKSSHAGVIVTSDSVSQNAPHTTNMADYCDSQEYTQTHQLLLRINHTHLIPITITPHYIKNRSAVMSL